MPGGRTCMVSYNMSGWRTIAGMLRNPKSDISVMVVTFLLTVVFDLTIAIEIGLLLAVVLFLRRVMENTEIKVYSQQLDVAEGTDLDASHHEVLDVLPGVGVYEIDGPFFFGVATKFDEMMRTTLGGNHRYASSVCVKCRSSTPPPSTTLKSLSARRSAKESMWCCQA